MGSPDERTIGAHGAQRDNVMNKHEEPRLTHEELTALLKRGVELDSAQPRDFTRDDLVDAGRELGVSGAAIDAAYQRHLNAHDQVAEPRPRIVHPADSKVRLEASPGHFYLYAPAPGFRWWNAVAFLTAPLFIAFAAVVLSWRRPGSDFPIVMVVLPVGMAVFQLSCALRDVLQTVTLELRGSEGRFLRRFGRTVTVASSQLRAQVDLGSRVPQTVYPGLFQPSLAIECGTKRHLVMRGYSRGELDWVAHEINQWLESN